MEYLLFFVIILIGLILYFIKGFFDKKSQMKKFKQYLYDNYGQFPTKEYKVGEFKVLSHYHLKHKDKDNFIDDITWNDLDMDRIYKLMNHTHSSAGAEYLYHLLRTPSTSQKTLDELEIIISYYQQNQDDRVDMQLAFAQLGSTGKFSLFDYLEYLVDLGHRDNNRHYIMNGLILLSFCIIPFNSMVGITGLIGSLGINMSLYFKDLKEISPYLTSINYILRLLGSVDIILKKDTTEVLKPYQKKLKVHFDKLKKFKQNANVATSNITSGGTNPLDILLDYFKMMFHVDIIKFNKMIIEIIKYEKEVDRMVTIIGYLDAAIAIGGFRESMPMVCTPNFSGGIHMKDAYHPLIKEPVGNTILTNKGVLLTGSNASGKSTFLKTVAINGLLAQTIHTCTAKSVTTDFYRIYSSMSLRDDLMAGESYYIVEIKSLKRILDITSDKSRPVLCFVDEVLRGTNTVERIAASTEILKSLAKPNIICFAATHDIELTHLLEENYSNYHFTEEIKDGDITFSYQLLKGRATTRNAIKLLSMIGYDNTIINKANKMAENFVSNGVWKEI